MSLNIEVLEQSFESIKPRSTEFASSFYHNLLTDHPQLQILFANTNMEGQAQKLMQTLSSLILNLRYPDLLAISMRDLGERHAGYGTLQEHYPIVEAALLKTFASYLGEAWQPEVEQAWQDAYQVVVALMLEGARRGEERLKPQKALQPNVQLLTKNQDVPVSEVRQKPQQPTQPDTKVQGLSQNSPVPKVDPTPQRMNRPVTRGEMLILFAGMLILVVLGVLWLRSNTQNNDTKNHAKQLNSIEVSLLLQSSCSCHLF
jgi:nitric oxide dioxygenase